MAVYRGTRSIIWHEGERMTVAALSERTGLSATSIYRRYREGDRDALLVRKKKATPALTEARTLLAWVFKRSFLAGSTRAERDQALADINKRTERYRKS